MTNRAPRYHLRVYELHDGKTTQVIDAYASAFITAIATFDGEFMDVHFNQGGAPDLQQHVADAVAHEYQRPR